MASNTKRGDTKKLVGSYSPFWIIWWSGLAGLLVDLDHALSLFLWRYFLPQIIEGRLWHTELFILTGIVICYMGAYAGRLHHKHFLIGAGVAMITILVLVYSPLVVWSWIG